MINGNNIVCVNLETKKKYLSTEFDLKRFLPSILGGYVNVEFTVTDRGKAYSHTGIRFKKLDLPNDAMERLIHMLNEGETIVVNNIWSFTTNDTFPHNKVKVVEKTYELTDPTGKVNTITEYKAKW